ncbi:carbon storage regulator [Teredinibacter sp. KSP-S5-2]|uniref:carbon storage regulator n=1 Tax=Teredinibacter sp. KSP-S5-2 TaxID=3034506 RepID=UPI0029345EA2|nr:carbon storage regulator [Teredinibacter sp. KSP-S5-2]WNO10459.1 carbon storage regulator [Teredinibacter sp. KSP-S5-2]
MLILTRRSSESIYVSDDIVITVIRINSVTGEVEIGISAPKDIPIYRQEVYERLPKKQPPSFLTKLFTKPKD